MAFPTQARYSRDMLKKGEAGYGVNLQETVGKVAGRRFIADAPTYGMKLQESAGAYLFRASGVKYPKGAYRFKSFAEADAWMRNPVSQNKAN